jgi:hypothetical protein
MSNGSAVWVNADIGVDLTAPSNVEHQYFITTLTTKSDTKYTDTRQRNERKRSDADAVALGVRSTHRVTQATKMPTTIPLRDKYTTRERYG